MSKATNFPKSKDEVVEFWKLMQKALIKIGSRQIEFWELEDIVEMALELQTSKVWEVEATYEKYPRMCVYLARVDMPVMEIVELHRRLRIQMDECDREDLETRGGVKIDTDRKQYVLGVKSIKEKNEK
ncbi:hypothetical protein CAEBREN_18010 [Caenorhabditis brenneri]|uniref:Uncharacterized protein n=1 Tax=Caenorhabditis brenneri TaxID=135651 RepID=G0NAF2_CAEBE|nr:hypothetical protein CAEBREN_18010 [Caenorhabditis brenneri]